MVGKFAFIRLMDEFQAPWVPQWLHCPDMGLTLVSIGKITAAGYKVIFRGPTCKVFDSKDKVIGLINVRNGLYRVDHDRVVNIGMAGEAREVLMVEELHRRMGHIAPETARKMVSDGAIKGIEINPSTMIQSCDSCEYAKATRKPIKKARVEPRASKFGDKIHSDVWGLLRYTKPVLAFGTERRY